VDIPFGEEEAIAMALQKRLDFLNAIDRLDDTRRKIKVAENGFLPELNVVGNGAFTSDPDRNNVTSWRPRDGRYSLGLEFDANFDRKEERNLYREALITFERAKRRLQQDADQIKLEIRNAFRTFIQARQSYEIQQQSLFLAQRRVESTEMLIQAGDATTRDLLDSQRALLSARNQVTRDLIDFNVARQELLSAMGILEVDASGMWKWPTLDEFETMFRDVEPPDNILITEDIEETDERYDNE
jgi:outer membrane protein TolC